MIPAATAAGIFRRLCKMISGLFLHLEAMNTFI